jgi:hypothetical protein
MEDNTLLFLSIKVRAPIRLMNQLRRIVKLIILFREKSDANFIFARLLEIAVSVYNFILYFYIIDNFFYQ